MHYKVLVIIAAANALVLKCLAICIDNTDFNVVSPEIFGSNLNIL